MGLSNLITRKEKGVTSIEICKEILKEIEKDLKHIDNAKSALDRIRAINSAIEKCDSMKSMLKSMKQ